MTERKAHKTETVVRHIRKTQNEQKNKIDFLVTPIDTELFLR